MTLQGHAIGRGRRAQRVTAPIAALVSALLLQVWGAGVTRARPA